MINDNTIQSVKDACNIADVIGSRIEIKKKGTNHIGKCPFHEEKTGSFTVTESKGIYKCFGCGASGDSIRFIMDYNHTSFPDAVRWLADFYHIAIDETKPTEADIQEQNEKERMYEVNELAAKRFHAHLLSLFPGEAWEGLSNGDGAGGVTDSHPFEGGVAEGRGGLHPVIAELMHNRALTLETITDFRIGYAPPGWRFLSDNFIREGYMDTAVKVGLIVHKDSSSSLSTEGKGEAANYDRFRSRIMFPITNAHGRVVGFGGRDVSHLFPNSHPFEGGMAEGRGEVPKYINSPDSTIYRKNQNLFGIPQALESIRATKEVILVEGYFDVTAMYQSRLHNTVAACGTAFTEGHAKLLSKYCAQALVMADGDAAGINSNMKTIDVLLEAGFKVDICPLPEGDDPDSLSRRLANEEALEAIMEM